jgi:hypothetical protein
MPTNITLKAISKYLHKQGIEHETIISQHPFNARYNNYIGIRPQPQYANQQPFSGGGVQYHLLITHETTTNTTKLENNYYRYPNSYKHQTHYKITDYSTSDPQLFQKLTQDIQKAQNQY